LPARYQGDERDPVRRRRVTENTTKSSLKKRPSGHALKKSVHNIWKFLADDPATLASQSGISKKAARRLIDQLSEIALGELFDLECVEVLDSPNIRYFVDAKTSRPLAELSTGQKGTVVIALNMIEGEGPLVIDHPEDPLDTESIYSQIVARFRESKDKRQFLVTTHNANVAVGADAELSHVLEATAKKGSVVASGSIDHQKTNDLLLLHLEGGGDALTMRVRKYGLDKE
ncbi:MAG: hypothetical protein WD205_11195, partial [Rhodothermales bacterium]